jgi:hypothetical protein
VQEEAWHFTRVKPQGFNLEDSKMDP